MFATTLPDQTRHSDMPTFKTRARTLDMLGRQQIAGIPTAISELLKNAHDAYAHHAEINYYRLDRLLVLRDDGNGMTHDEFVGRWLTIGTENKLSDIPDATPETGRRFDPRPMLGEKGIGRLAIATIGPQVLVLSRSRSGDSPSELTVAFVNWTLFECPGVDLDNIHVPIRIFTDGSLPSSHDVAAMVADFRANIRQLHTALQPEVVARINDELATFSVDPQKIDLYHPTLTLSGSGCGTHFLILPTSDLLPVDIDGEPGADRATPLMKALLGFTNTMTPDHSTPVISAAFRDHKAPDLVDDLIADGEFFTPDEFHNADHQVRGQFDAYGQFRGAVSIYGEVIPDHVIPWRGAAGQPTQCGPFTITFAAIEGDGKHSTLPPDDHARMSRKMATIGGLYIYRDGIRVLPYGDTTYDWLDIEYHRTKSAYYYYFSHRKMFGAIEIDATNNRLLNEKAGREGFRENRAYRQFKSILKHFLLQIAADFFRKEGVHSERFRERKAELTKEEHHRRKRERLVTAKKAKLSDDLNAFFRRVSSNDPQDEALRLSEKVSNRIKTACDISELPRAAEEILAVEQDAMAALRRFESDYTISRPRIPLSKAMQRDFRVATGRRGDSCGRARCHGRPTTLRIRLHHFPTSDSSEQGYAKGMAGLPGHTLEPSRDSLPADT